MEKMDLFAMTATDYYNWQHPVPERSFDNETNPDGNLGDTSYRAESYNYSSAPDRFEPPFASNDLGYVIF